MSIFNLINQNENLDNKLVSGLERISQVFRILLWEKSKEYKLSPIQIQLLIFIQNHSQEKATISYLAKEFNFTKPTISDAVKILEKKKLIKKNNQNTDARSYTIQLTSQGKKIVSETDNYAAPITEIIKKSKHADKLVLWDIISNLITKLNELEIISVQRTCYNCKYFVKKGNLPYCNLLEQKLKAHEIRIDCQEFEAA